MKNYKIKFESGDYELKESVPEIACRVFNKNLREAEISPSKVSPADDKLSLENYLDSLKQQKVDHLTLKTTCPTLLAELTSKFGAPIVSIETWGFAPHQQELPKLKLFCSLREYQPQDFDDLANITRTGFAFTRFYKDPFFNKALCGELYEEILKTYVSDSTDRTRFTVGLKKEKVIGYLAWKKRTEIIDGKTVKISGSGLGAVSPGQYGCYPAILHQSIAQFGKENDFLEFDGQTDNPQALRIFEFLGMKKQFTKNIFHIAV